MDIETILREAGVDYKIEFVPVSASGRTELGVNWKLTLSKGKAEYGFSYWTGIGHIKGYNGEKTIAATEAVEYICEYGKNLRVDYGIYYSLSLPKLEDIFECLVSDAGAINYTFEEWCEEFGYNSDSIKDSETYGKCLETGIRLRNLLTSKVFEELTENIHNYN